MIVIRIDLFCDRPDKLVKFEQYKHSIQFGFSCPDCVYYSNKRMDAIQ